MAAASRASSTPCTASRRIRRATSIRPKHIAASAFSDSCIKVSEPWPNWIREPSGRKSKEVTTRSTKGAKGKSLLRLLCFLWLLPHLQRHLPNFPQVHFAGAKVRQHRHVEERVVAREPEVRQPGISKLLDAFANAFGVERVQHNQS